MLSEHEKRVAAESALERMLRGERVIVCEEVLDAIDRIDICTCSNAKRVGILDQFVAWIGKENRPKDLEYNPNTGMCSGSV